MLGSRSVGHGTDPVARLLGSVPTVVTFAVTACSALAILLGPAAAKGPVPPDLVASPDLFVSEPADRLALLSWWLIPVALLVLGLIWVRRARQRHEPDVAESRGRLLVPLLMAILELLALAVLVLSITWPFDITGMWSGISLVTLLVGALLAVAVVVTLVGPRVPARVVSVVLLCLAVIVAVTNLWQTPTLISDPTHFEFTGDELSAVAAGRFPLGDYVPQYTTLLAFPIAPVLTLLGPQAPYGVVGWVLALQLLALALAVLAVYRVGGKRTIAPAALLVCAPVVAAGADSTSTSSYFAVLPLRLVLPSMLIVAATVLLRDRRGVRSRLPWMPAVGVGVLAGLVALNNPDYGIPAVLAVVAVVGITSDGWRSLPGRMGAMLAGIVFVPIGFWILAFATGNSVNWADWLFFQRIFGQRGFMSVGLLPFGMYVAVVSLFVATTVTGILLMKRPARHAGTSIRVGTLLALVGLWSLLCLPYYAGRSVSPGLEAGYAFLVGFNAAALLPLVPAAARLRTSRLRRPPSLELAGYSARPFLFLTIAAVASCLLLAVSPWVRTQTAWNASSSPPAIDTGLSLAEVLGSLPASSLLRSALQDGTLRQALRNGSLVALGTGIPVVGPATHPAYYELVPSLAARLCTSPELGSRGLLLVEPMTADALERVPTCTGALDFTNGTVVATQSGDIVAIPFGG